MSNTAAVMEKGIDVLLKHLGVLDTELFISTLLEEPFDYTEWQREHFAGIDLETFNRMAAEYDQNNPVKSGD
jgi:hypothetical protein